MKIGFFGNTNNFPFMLARAFRRMGQDVLFIVSGREPLHRPENRYDDIFFPYPDWIYDASHFAGRDCLFPTPKHVRVVRLLRSCDAVVLNGFGPSLSSAINRPAAVLLTGSDLDFYGNFRATNNLLGAIYKRPVWLSRMVFKPLASKLISLQRSGIRSAKVVNYFAPGLIPHGDALLDEIGVEDSRRVYFMMSDLQGIPYEPSPMNWPVRIFCATRFTWKKPLATGASELDYKGSDIMIRGLGLFLRATGIPLEIRFVKKGPHVNDTMRLVLEEGLSKQVTWVEEMTQLELVREFKNADIVIEQLGLSMVGMAGLDVMAIGRPVIANGRPEIMKRVLGVPSPICQAASPEEVCAQLQRLVPDRDERERVGLASRKYVEEYFSADNAARICLDRLEKCS